MRAGHSAPSTLSLGQRASGLEATAAGEGCGQARDVDVWRADLDAPGDTTVAWLESLLAPDEVDRTRRFFFARDRRRYVVGRGILRVVLGRYVGRAPAALTCAYGANGKPRLVTNEIHFNVAHSDALALFAVSRTGEVGIDVERIRDLPDCDDVAKSAFSPQELAKLQACPPERRQEEFFHAWARQEAVLKALGTGLADVKADAVQRGFSVYPLKVDEGFAAALALAAPARVAETILSWDESKRSDGRCVTEPGTNFNFT